MADISTRLANDRDLKVLRDIYRRSSLSNQGDRANLLASPAELHWAGTALPLGGRVWRWTDAVGSWGS
jgi:hypothetical protein